MNKNVYDEEEIYEEEEYKNRFPIIAKICEEKLQDMSDWYFGQCFYYDNIIEVYYVNETNEDRGAFFSFTDDNKLVEFSDDID